MSRTVRIGDLKDVHEGKRLFVLASGPSLTSHDLSLLDRRLVMGLNRSFFAYPHAYYHCAMDRRLFDLFPTQLTTTRCLFTLPSCPWGIRIELLGAEGFSWDLEEGIYSGYTISYYALQVAVYMGFKEIFYLGLDLRHQNGNTHFFGQDFHSRDHELTEFPRMLKMLQWGAAEVAPSGVSIYNCSPITGSNFFLTMNYADAVAR